MSKPKILRKTLGLFLTLVIMLSTVCIMNFTANAGVHYYYEGEVFELYIPGTLNDEPAFHNVKNIHIDNDETTAVVEILSQTQQNDPSDRIALKIKALSYGRLVVRYEAFTYGNDSNGSWDGGFQTAAQINPVIGANEQRTFFIKGVKLGTADADENVKDFASENSDIVEFVSAKNVTGGVEVTVKSVSGGESEISYNKYSEEYHQWFSCKLPIKVVSEQISEDINFKTTDLKIGTKTANVKVSGYNNSVMDLEKTCIIDSNGNKIDEIKSDGKYTLINIFKAKGANYFKESTSTAKEYAKSVSVNSVATKGYIGDSFDGVSSVTYNAAGEMKYLVVEHKFEIKTDKKAYVTSPKTGDSNNMGVWFLLLIASFGVVFVLMHSNKKAKITK